MLRLSALAVLATLLVAAPAQAAGNGALPVPRHQDVNGDGRDDVVFGGCCAEPHLFTVFGKGDRGFVDVRTPGVWGQTIDGPLGGLPFGDVVGDVNGDGRADITTFFSPTAEAVILPGQSAAGSLRAQSPPPLLRLRNGGPFAAGDVNGDGLEDLAVSYTRTRGNDRIGLVFGSRTRRSVDLARDRLGARFTVPRGQHSRRGGNLSVTGVGDLDRDGIDDVAVSADWVPSRTCRLNRNLATTLCDGRIWVVYGRRQWPARIDVAKLGRRAGFQIRSKTSFSRGGRFLRLGRASAAGDLDGDGFEDMVFTLEEGYFRPATVVVWGSRHRRARPLLLTRRTSRLRDRWRHGIFPVADFDGDGRTDLIGSPDLGPTETFPNRRLRTFLIRGRRWSGVRTLGPRRARDGFVLFRDVEPFVRPADVNGDGRSDLFSAPALTDGALTAWVVFGDPSRRRVDVDASSFRGFRFGIP